MTTKKKTKSRAVKRKTPTARPKPKPKERQPKERQNSKQRSSKRASRRDKPHTSKAARQVTSELRPPVQPAVSRLPIDDAAQFGWRRFELFCRAFVSSLPDIVSCKHYGKQGDAQRGIDLVATMSDGTEVTYQCRQWAEFNGAHVEETIKKTKYVAKRHVILTSAEATVGARDAIRRRRKTWDLWDIEDISQEVRNLPPEDARSLVTSNFGAGWCRAFLGVAGLAAFRSSERSLAPLLDPKRAFNHAHRLLARDVALHQLAAFAHNANERVAIVSGAGGVGKTRLLLELARVISAEDDATRVLRVEDGVPVTESVLAQLPVGACVLVADDAHRRSDLTILLALARQRANMKLILVTRPHATERLRNEVRYAKFRSDEVSGALLLKKLSSDDILTLVRDVLGGGKQHAQLDTRLATVADGSPLVATIAAALVRDKAIAPEHIQNDEAFAEEVFSKFEDALVGDVAPTDGEGALIRKILPVVAALSPLRTQDDKLIEAIATHAGEPASTVRLALENLEKAGILLRNGDVVRITPDVLADHILARKSVTADGQPTGFSSELISAFGMQRIEPLLRNFSELDWRMRRVRSAARTGVEELWQFFETRFADAEADVRDALLAVLEDVAYFQPAQAVGFVQRVIKPSDGGERLPDRITQRCVRVLVRCGYTLGHLHESTRMLLNLAAEQASEAAVTALVAIAAYDIDKPLQVQEILLDALEEWLPDHSSLLGVALRIVKPLFAKTGMSTTSDRRQFTMTAFAVTTHATTNIRKRARTISIQGLRSAQGKVRYKAVDILCEDAGPPMMMLGRDISDAEKQSWVDERRASLLAIERLLKSTTDAVLHLAISSKLRWQARHGDEPMRSDVRAALASIPDDFDHRLTTALRGDFHARIDVEDFDFKRDMAAFEDAARLAAREYIDKYPSAVAACEDLERRLTALAEWEGASPFAFLVALVQLDAAYTIGVMNQALDVGAVHVTPLLSSVLEYARATDPVGVAVLMERALRGGSDARFAVANSLGAAATDVTEREREVWRQLLLDDDLNVRARALNVLGALAKSDAREALDLLLSARFDGEKDRRAHLVNELCSVLHGIQDNVLGDVDMRKVLDIIRDGSSISDYWIGDFIGRAMRRLPADTLRMLIARIERAQARDYTYQAVPFEGLRLGGLRGHADYESILRKAIDVGRKKSAFYAGASQLFRDIVLLDIERGTNVLRSILTSGLADDVKYVAQLLAALPSAVVIDQSPLVAEILHAAQRLDLTTLVRIESTLRGALIPSGWQSVVGEPDPKQVQAMEKAKALAEGLPEGSLERVLFEKVAAAIGRTIEEHVADDDDWLN